MDGCHLTILVIYFHNVNADWFEAQSHCENSFRGYLAEITSRDENTFLRNQAKIQHAVDPSQGRVNGYWIGASDMEVEGIWLWMKSRERIQFNDWMPGEPNNALGHEDCAHLHAGSDFHWYDDKCSSKLYFICEKPNLPDQTEIIG